MDYKNYTVEDFVLNRKFREWVLNPNKEIIEFWAEWSKKNPERVPLLKEARNLILNIPKDKDDLNEVEINLLWNAIHQQILDQSNSPTFRKKVVPSRDKEILARNPFIKKYKVDYQIITKVAATIIIIFCVGISYLLVQKPREIYKEQPVLVNKETSWGQRSTIFLHDGTEVNLNTGSKIEYLKKFSENERLIKLTGEAFFKVAKDEKRPFKVLSGNIVTQALGTSFNITAYDQEKVSVALVTGKVVLDNIENGEKSQSIILSPGEKAEYKIEKGFTKSEFNKNQILSWKDGVIYFKNANEDEVFTTLERWYGVKIIRNGKSIKDWSYNASFKNQSLEQILNSISHSMEFQFDINQKSVMITYN